MRFGEIIELISGQHIITNDYNNDRNGVPYLTGPIDFSEIYPIISKWTEKPKVISIMNDILITVKGAGVGKINILNIEKVSISRQLMAIRNLYQLELMYLFYFQKYHYMTFQNLSIGIAIPGISREDVLNILFSLPPLNEQKRIVSKVNQLMNLCDELEQNIEQSKKDSKLLMQAVLQEAFAV